MTEDKTKEQQPAAQPVRQPRRQKLRSLWAQLQCRGVLRRHRLRRKRQHRRETLWHKLLHNPVAPMVGETLYAIGFSAEYAVIRTGRRLQHGLQRLLQMGRDLLKNIASMAFPGAARLLRDLFGPVVLALRGTGALLRHAHRVRKQKGFGAALRASGHFIADGIADNIRLVPRMAMYVLPAAALAVMVTVFQTTIRQPYALQVQVDDKTVGYVANEEVFNSALEAVQQRINYSGTEQARFTVEPTYSVTVAHDVMDENDVADAILKTSSDQISEGTALYLDGELTAVCADGTGLQRYISSLLEPYENPDDPNTTVGFNKDVTLENGIYFNESFQEEAEVEQLLSGVQQAEKILHGAERRYHLVHCPEKRPDREGTVRNEHRLYRQRRKRPDTELQDPARRCTDRGAGGGNAGGAHHQGGKLGGRDRLHHRDHQIQRAELRYQARYPEG